MRAGTVYVGDCVEVMRSWPDECVQCVVTSPPYWGLRDYGTPGQLGLEPTPEEYVTKMVKVFREVRRVLRKDGTLWLNMGDCYASAPNGTRHESAKDRTGNASTWRHGLDDRTFRDKPFSTISKSKRIERGSGRWGGGNYSAVDLKPKDLVGMPWRLAFALQADGWYLRSDIIWSKPNPMPESVTDRPTKAHEYVFLLTKSARYFYDAEAVREASVGVMPGDLDGGAQRAADGAAVNGGRNYRSKKPDGWDTGSGGHGSIHRDGREKGEPSEIRTGRNLRSVWSIATQPFPGAHFATFPEALVVPCVKAGTSERGCCAECGSPWARAVDVSYDDQGRTTNGPRSAANREITAGFDQRLVRQASTTGWRAPCDHTAATVPCVVLDPFAGSGTTLMVAQGQGRHFVGIELSPEYAQIAMQRIGMFAKLAE